MSQETSEQTVPRGRRVLIYVLLALPFVACLYPGWYNRINPELFGVPFFITYQMALVFFGIAVMAVAYQIDRRARNSGRPASQADLPESPT